MPTWEENTLPSLGDKNSLAWLYWIMFLFNCSDMLFALVFRKLRKTFFQDKGRRELYFMCVAIMPCRSYFPHRRIPIGSLRPKKSATVNENSGFCFALAACSYIAFLSGSPSPVAHIAQPAGNVPDAPIVPASVGCPNGQGCVLRSLHCHSV